MKKVKHRCPDCKKVMKRHKRVKEFWWNCSGYPRCIVTARDYKGKPEFIKKERIAETDFLSQLNFIKYIIKDLRAQVLIRLIQNKGSLSALSEKHISMYYSLVEPIRASFSFVKCCRCNNTLDASESLYLEKDRYLCDWCWGH
jgi:endo-beta-N-acetylglucosaminidase D